MAAQKFEYIIIGSGTGGATLARELTKRGKQPLVIETGKPETSIGTFLDSTRIYDLQGLLLKMPKLSREGVILWRTLMAGGASIVSCGNGVRCLEKELALLGVDIINELGEAEKELRVAPLAERLLSDGSREIRKAAAELGYSMEFMPKFIDAKACRKCGQCTLGCVHQAKWTSLEYLKEATAGGAQVWYGTRCLSVNSSGGRVTGVTVKGTQGLRTLEAGTVIVAAGGLGTPVILLNSGIKNAGTGLFVDLLVNTYGTTAGLNQVHEPSMALVNHDFYEEHGFILSPYVNHPAYVRFRELGAQGLRLMRDKRTIGIMTKIRDENSGQVFADGSVSKTVTPKDREKLNAGSRISSEILKKAGASGTAVSRVQGAHPGGTSAIGRVVDKDLQTEIENLYVCDASVLPVAPGLPPILTIVALAKRLAVTIAP